MQQQQLKRSKKVYKTKREILEELWRLFNTHTHTHTLIRILSTCIITLDMLNVILSCFKLTVVVGVEG